MDKFFLNKFLNTFLFFIFCSINTTKAQQELFDTTINFKLNNASIFLKSKLWITDNFQQYKSVVQMEDKDAGVIVIKGTLQYQHPYYKKKKTGPVAEKDPWTDKAAFNIKFFISDGSLKIVVTEITLLDPSGIFGLDTRVSKGMFDGTYPQGDDISAINTRSKVLGMRDQLQALYRSVFQYINQ